MEMTKERAAYDLFDVLADMLEEYEYDAECHEKCGMETRTQRDIILRARNAINKFSPGHITKPPYWEEDD